MITTEQIKELRDMTGVSIMQCKKALEEAGGDKEKALFALRKKSKEIAAKKDERTLGASVVDAYIHSNKKVGTLIELSCETDFVARNEEFIGLAREIAMHIAAMNPEFIDETQISDEARATVAELFKKEVEESGKSAELQAKMMEGKLKTYFAEKTLLNQAFVKNPDMTITDLINQYVQKFGEKIAVARFVRFSAAK